MVDLSVLEVLQDAKLDRKQDFMVTENYHIRLRPNAAAALIDRVSANLNRKVKLKGRSWSYESIITETARGLARHLTTPGGRFDISYPFSVGESGYVPTDLTERVLSMTVADRKAAGISKTTWHYIKRRAETGKPLRLYRKVADRVA